MTATSAPSTAPSKNVFRLHGVNILNRKNVDSISRLTALERRRATHILDERQRRDTMNQLLGELANLVRESAAEAQAQAQESQTQQKQLNPDGTEKRPPVKSNSITTLRNAIAEIRRLRASAGMETLTPPCAASLAVATPAASRSSSPVAQNKQYQQQPQQPLPALTQLAPHYSNNGSHHATMSSPSPKAYSSQAHATMAPFGHQSQLQSPPLSPSSPALHQYPSSCPVSPPMMPTHQGPSLFASSSASYSSYQSQPSQKQQYYSQSSYYQSQQPQSNYTSPRYEPYSRPSSPSFSSSVNLPQPYLPLPSTYQTSSVSSYGQM
ncbi:hypothetical protein B0O80DRAFT_437429 [Mortierella sp. GBAus27b]|nr:hypothetical protein B0O80DRAFT_437429 [Mortierella sp. GBAus27b]